MLTQDIINTFNDFPNLLNYVRENRLSFPDKKRIYLDSARTDELRTYAGNYLSVVASANLTDTIDIKFNRDDVNAITFSKGLSIRTPYYCLYLTNSAIAGGYIDIVTGILSPELLEIIDMRSALDQTTLLQNIKDELVGKSTGTFNRVQVGTSATLILAANTSRKSCKLCANPNNTSDIYIGLANTVATTKYVIRIAPGQTVDFNDYLGAFYGLAITNNDEVGYAEIA